MDRRRFLTLGAGAGALGLAGAGAGVAAAQPRRRVVPGTPGAERPDKPRRVGVIGGGLAGLSSALQLSRRGFEVHLFESAPHLGGKLGGWDVEALGRTWPVEHGFHGFFSQYYNLWELLEEAGAAPHLAPVTNYPILFANQPTEHFVPSSAPFPFNLFGVLSGSRSVGISDFLGKFPGMFELMGYEEKKTFAARDGISFAEFLRTAGIPPAMAETVLIPFGNASMNHLERMSAAEGIRFFHVYFFGNPEGLGFRILTKDVMAAVVDRIEALVTEHRVTVHLSTPVQRLALDRGRVTELVLESSSPLAGVTIPEAERFVSAASLSSEWSEHAQVGGAPLFVRAGGSGAEAMLGRCTHMGCSVQRTADGFLCPCHGGGFDDDGRVVRGPPPRPLHRLALAPVDGGYSLAAPAVEAERRIPVDYAVLACNASPARALVERSEGLDGPWTSGVRQLEPADPYAVLRVWFDRPVRSDRAPFYSVHQYRYTHSLAIYSAFQEPYITWANENRASVVESHAYGINPPERYEAVRSGMLAELRIMLPELAEAKILHEEMQMQRNFTSFPPGFHGMRPSTRSDAKNLFAAGDWVRLPVPAFLMEAAVTSGRIAANAVLEAEGLRTEPYAYVDPKGPLS